MSKLLSNLANVQHEIWAHWMRYLFKVSKTQEDGSVVIPSDKAQRWRRQMETSYANLSDTEKQSDIEQAMKVITVINSSEK